MSSTAVISGASSGIGKILAEELAKVGFQVVIAARSKDKLKTISNNIQLQGGRCLSIPTDVSKPDDIKKLKNETLNFGSVEILINNAGMGHFGPIESLSIEEWNQQLDVNLRAAFLLSQAFIPEMKKARKGTLVFINSIAGRQPFSQSAAYVASKFGLRGLASSLREELRENNIKVISVYPGAVNTPFWDKINGDFSREDMLNASALAQLILQSLQAPGNLTVEEMVVRRGAGDI